ncbi:hypothetical protein QPK87_09785 [Kamptonema cortianum]|nr:hypothetical protein [Kamptonema cortianum]
MFFVVSSHVDWIRHFSNKEILDSFDLAQHEAAENEFLFREAAFSIPQELPFAGNLEGKDYILCVIPTCQSCSATSLSVAELTEAYSLPIVFVFQDDPLVLRANNIDYSAYGYTIPRELSGALPAWVWSGDHRAFLAQEGRLTKEISIDQYLKRSDVAGLKRSIELQGGTK